MEPRVRGRVAQVEFVLSGFGTIATRRSPDVVSTNNYTYSAAWNTTTVANGNCTVFVRVTDSVGNTGESAPIHIKVQN